MAEAVGLALGVVGLAGTLKSCADLISFFSSNKSFGRDHQILEVKLNVQKALLLQWAKRVRLLYPDDYDKRLDDPDTQSTVSCILAAIQQLLSETTRLEQRYELRAVSPSSTPRTLFNSCVDRLTLNRMEKFNQDFEKLKINIAENGKAVSASNRLRWIIVDKEKSEKLAQELSDFHSTSEFMAKEDVSRLNDVKSLALIYDATSDSGEQYMADADAERLDNLRTRIILDKIWFRSLHERRDAVEAAHHNTLRSALESPENTSIQDVYIKWDSLPSWLESDNQVYWISGKAGSGKSTTAKFLSKWAGTSPLCIGGLSQAILHQVLDVQHHLLQGEACPPPTDTELSMAFDKLSSHDGLNRSFCFFIDGLDELDGDYHYGTSYIRKLAQNPKIKVVEFPSLQLQDLTCCDIAHYIQSTLGSHLYMEKLTVSNSIGAASGVFLWVILACRSLVNGLAACDNIQELRKRVDELPLELEDLFTHMLNRVERRYYGQAAKMLRICYQRHNNGHKFGSLIYSLPWAVVYDSGRELKDCEVLRIPSLIERRSIYASTEGRLRSRCGGLLEIRPCLRSDACYTLRTCQCGATDEIEHDTLFGPTIEFMHRSVFEFLDTPETWEMECLRIEDAAFDVNAGLAVISLYMAQVSLQRRDKRMSLQELSRMIDPTAYYYIMNAIGYARHADTSSKDGGLVVLSKLEEILKVGSRPTRKTEEPCISSLVLAVEIGMVDCAKYLLKGLRDSHSGYPLLYHATERPFLRWFRTVPHSSKMVQVLLLEGCQPNERFKDEDGMDATPWTSWLRHGADVDPQDMEPADTESDRSTDVSESTSCYEG
ncbi:prion-inhibition and propagation-domain-containing protein [Xylaria sp. FL0043]|nr:prion-inhibition and propagation-domain-containing protein [Xylaria sp. FL0043]